MGKISENQTKLDIKISQPSGNDTCETFICDPQKVERRQREVEKTDGLGSLFKVLADDTRLKIIYALSQEDELCVCDVATIIGATNAATSHHLRLLRNMGLAIYRKEGKLAFYSLQSKHVDHLIREALRLKGKE